MLKVGKIANNTLKPQAKRSSNLTSLKASRLKPQAKRSSNLTPPWAMVRRSEGEKIRKEERGNPG
jgi:hypothetical protein